MDASPRPTWAMPRVQTDLVLGPSDQDADNSLTSRYLRFLAPFFRARCLLRAFRPSFVRIRARNPFFLRLLTLLLRGFSIVSFHLQDH